MKITVAFLACASLACAAVHYCYSGSDPRQWVRQELSTARAAGSAADYSVYLGDSYDYRVAKVITDSTGNVYVTGARLIPFGSFGENGFTNDIFVTKLDASGTLVFTATISGKGSDAAKDIAVDADGNIYVAGSTSSGNFPLRAAMQSQYSGATAGFVLKLSPDGSQLIFSTYFGGTRAFSSVEGIALDASRNIYLTGATNSSDFPVSRGLSLGHPSTGLAARTETFIAKLTPAADRIVYSGVIGGDAVACGAGSSCFLSARRTFPVGIALDSAGNAVIAGNANVTNLPTTPGALLSTGIGAYAAKVKSDGSGLLYLTYLAARNDPISPFSFPGNTAYAVAVDAAGNAVIAGSTNDEKFPATAGVVQSAYSGPVIPVPTYPSPQTDGFVAKLKADGTGMVWATYLGGKDPDAARSVSLDAQGNVWVSGTTESAAFPNANGWTTGGEFVAELNASGSALLYSAQMPAGTSAQAVAAGGTGTVHIAGTGGILSAFDPAQPRLAHVYGTVNAAAGSLSGRIAPQEIISVFGPHIGPATPASFKLDSSGNVSSSLGGVQVTFDGAPAPLLYVSDTQINAIVPSAIRNQSSARLRVQNGSATLPDFTVRITPTLPEIFRTGGGSAAAVNQDGTINSAQNPAKAGTVVSIWASGTGATSFGDAAVATDATNGYCCTAAVNGDKADVLYAGPSPGLIAVATQINLRLPESVYATQVSVTITASGRTSSSAPVYVVQ